MRAIITDSTTLISQNQYDDIFVLPVDISIDNNTYRDGIDITATEVLNKIDTNDVKTSLPSMRELVKVLKEIYAKGYDEIVVLVLGSKLSGTFNSIRLLFEDHVNVPYKVIDTRTISVPLKYLVEYIHDECANMPLDKLEDECIKFIENSRLLVVPESLKYLVRGGRLSALAGAVGEALNVRPIIELVDGEFKSIKKCRGRLANKEMIKILREFNGDSEDSCFACATGTNLEDSSYFDSLIEGYKVKKMSVELLSPSVCVHIGPRVLGFLCIKKWR